VTTAKDRSAVVSDFSNEDQWMSLGRLSLQSACSLIRKAGSSSCLIRNQLFFFHSWMNSKRECENRPVKRTLLLLPPKKQQRESNPNKREETKLTSLLKFPRTCAGLVQRSTRRRWSLSISERWRSSSWR